jgi:hypothetical protein
MIEYEHLHISLHPVPYPPLSLPPPISVDSTDLRACFPTRDGPPVRILDTKSQEAEVVLAWPFKQPGTCSFWEAMTIQTLSRFSENQFLYWWQVQMGSYLRLGSLVCDCELVIAKTVTRYRFSQDVSVDSLSNVVVNAVLTKRNHLWFLCKYRYLFLKYCCIRVWYDLASSKHLNKCLVSDCIKTVTLAFTEG